MTQPTRRQIEESEQLPTSIPGLMYALVRVFGAWALIAVATVVLWTQYKEVNSKLMAMLESNITASHANTKAMESMAAEIRKDREEGAVNLGKMDDSVTALFETVRENRTMLKDNSTFVRESSGVLHEIKNAVDSLKPSTQ